MLQIYKLSTRDLLVAAFLACVEFRQNAPKREYSLFSTNLKSESKCDFSLIALKNLNSFFYDLDKFKKKPVAI
jgi:hypothetical protein